MTSYEQKLDDLYERLDRSYGPVRLFGFFEPASLAEKRGDIVIAADGLKEEFESYKIVTGLLNEIFSTPELSRIERVVIRNPRDKSVKRLMAILPRNGESYDLYNFEFGGTSVRAAHIIRASRKTAHAKA